MVKLYLSPMENYYLIPVADEELVYLPVVVPENPSLLPDLTFARLACMVD